jgi:hypothetical protein
VAPGLDEGTFRQHVPDLLLTLSGGQLLVVDVKLERFANHPRARATFAWTSQLCSTRGWLYQVWTEADCDPVELANIQSLAVGRRLRILGRHNDHPYERENVVGRKLSDFAVEVQDRQITLSKAWSGQWMVDLNRPLSWQSKIVGVCDHERH